MMNPAKLDELWEETFQRKFLSTLDILCDMWKHFMQETHRYLGLNRYLLMYKTEEHIGQFSTISLIVNDGQNQGE